MAGRCEDGDFTGWRIQRALGLNGRRVVSFWGHMAWPVFRANALDAAAGATQDLVAELSGICLSGLRARY